MIEIRDVTHADLDDVVTIHCRAFETSAITALGREAVRRYYAWLLDGPHDAEFRGAWQRDGARALVGFCAAGMFRGALTGFLRANQTYLALRVLTHPWLVTTPLIRQRLRQAVQLLTRRRPSPTATAVEQRRFGVLAIATDPRVRGTGAGRALMLDAETLAHAAGYERASLTVHPTNVHAIEFYERLGWTRISTDGTWRGAMEKLLDRA